MRFVFSFVAALFSVVAHGAPQQVTRLDPRAQHSSPERDAALSRVEAAFAAADVRDAVFVVGAGDKDPVVFVKGKGGLDRRYHSDSAQKWILAVMLLREARERGVTLDQPLSTWPAAKNLAWAQGEVGQTTLRQLLSFTSGYEDPPFCAKVQQGSFARCLPKLVTSKRTTPRRYAYGTHHMFIALAALSGEESPTTGLLARFRKETGLLSSASWPGEKPISLEVTPREYAAFLRALSQHALLTADDEREMFTDQVQDLAIGASPADRPAQKKKGLAGRWHYGFGNWVRCDEGAPCSPHHHSAGARGFYPFVDVDSGVYGLVAHNDDVGDWAAGHFFYEAVKDDLAVVVR